MNEIKNKLQANKKYEAKLSWKRKEVIETTNQIEEFAALNFNITLPSHKKELKKRANINEDYKLFLDNFPQVSSFYYQVKYSGQSIASLFDNGNEIDTYTHAHMYSKHRLDEVWNWRKSVLIRNIYRNYLKESKIYQLYTPVHVVLTLPHPEGKYEGKRFYTKELLEKFEKLRNDRGFFKQFVYGGEYGVEHKKSISGEGYHIHIHSLMFLKNTTINDFRILLQKNWKALTGATQIWCEGLYYYKKDDKGKFINEVIYNTNIKEENEFGEIETIFGQRIVRRKKFYIENEAKAISKDENLSYQEQNEKIENCYLSGIMECIKYHFKNDCMKDKNGNYDIEVMEEVLSNTKGKRLYSRFGQFYKVKELCFNKLHNPETEETTDEEVMGTVKSEFAINPFTGEEVAAQETELVLFDPAKRTHQPRTAIKPYALITQSKKIYHPLDTGLTVKEAIRSVINSMYGNKKNKKVKNKGKTPNQNKNNYKP